MRVWFLSDLVKNSRWKMNNNILSLKKNFSNLNDHKHFYIEKLSLKNIEFY